MKEFIVTAKLEINIEAETEKDAIEQAADVVSESKAKEFDFEVEEITRTNPNILIDWWFPKK